MFFYRKIYDGKIDRFSNFSFFLSYCWECGLARRSQPLTSLGGFSWRPQWQCASTSQPFIQDVTKVPGFLLLLQHGGKASTLFCPVLATRGPELNQSVPSTSHSRTRTQPISAPAASLSSYCCRHLWQRLSSAFALDGLIIGHQAFCDLFLCQAMFCWGGLYPRLG